MESSCLKDQELQDEIANVFRLYGEEYISQNNLTEKQLGDTDIFTFASALAL